MTQSHQLFRFAKQMQALDYHVLCRMLYNWGDIARKILKNRKTVKVWGPLTRVRGGNSKKWLNIIF